MQEGFIINFSIQDRHHAMSAMSTTPREMASTMPPPQQPVCSHYNLCKGASPPKAAAMEMALKIDFRSHILKMLFVHRAG